MVNYKIIDTLDELEELQFNLLSQSAFCLDLETTSINPQQKDLEIVGIGFCWTPGEAYYVPFNSKLDPATTLQTLSIPIQSETIGKIGQNLKYDALVLNRFGVIIGNIIFDTLVAHYTLFSDRTSHNLDDMSLFHHNYVKIRTSSVIPKKSKLNPSPTMKQTSVQEVADYCMEDVDWCYRLYQYLSKLLDSNPVSKKIYYEIDHPAYLVLIDMEKAGVKIDTQVLQTLEDKVVKESVRLNDEITQELGKPLEISKPRQIETVLYDEQDLLASLGVEIVTTKTGKRSTGAKELKKLKASPIVSKILTIKEYNKLVSTYTSSIPKAVSDVTGFVHTNFNIHITSTGRISSSSPINLQNIPIRTPLGKEVRASFVSRWADIGGKILSVDYGQCEIRLLAHMSKEPVFLEVYRSGGDAHTSVACKITGKTPDQIDSDTRRIFKTINFGVIYGQGPKKLAEDLNISLDEAKKFLKQYLGTMTKVAELINKTNKFLKKNGYTETLFGRRRYIPKIFSDEWKDVSSAQREGFNHLCQGSNADLTKIAMARVKRFLESHRMQSLMIIQVHDEIVLDVHPSELATVKDNVINLMETCVKLDVPMVADGKYGNSWLEAH